MIAVKAPVKEIERWTEGLGPRVERALERAMKSEGYRLKQEMSDAIRQNAMGWPPIHPYTRALRKYRKSGPPGIWFSRFVRYGVGRGPDGMKLEVGVFNPDATVKVKPLSRTVIAGSERFVRGWTEVVTLRAQRKRVARYLMAKRRQWKMMSPRQKRIWREKMAREGVLVRVGTVLRAPSRPMDPFLRRQRQRISSNIEWLFDKAVRGERYARDWWRAR